MVQELFTVAYLPRLAWGLVSNTLREWETVKLGSHPLGTFKKKQLANIVIRIRLSVVISYYK